MGKLGEGDHGVVVRAGSREIERKGRWQGLEGKYLASGDRKPE